MPWDSASEPRAARRVERFVQRAVDFDFLETFERRGVDDLAVDHGLTGVAVFVDEALGGPGQRVLEYVVRVLRQGADAQLDGAKLVEMLGELVGGDADEAWRESTLGHERLRCTTRDPPHALGDGHVFGEIEVVSVALARRFGHGRVAVVGQAGDDRLWFVGGEMVVERLEVVRVERDRPKVVRPVSFHDGFRRRGIYITQRDVIIARLRQQTRDEGADLAGTQYENFVHEYLVWR